MYGAVQSACTHFMTPRPENRPKFFWDPIWVPDNQKYQKKWFFIIMGGPGGPFSKKPKIDIFQKLNFPDPVSRLPLDLESWNFLW